MLELKKSLSLTDKTNKTNPPDLIKQQSCKFNLLVITVYSNRSPSTSPVSITFVRVAQPAIEDEKPRKQNAAVTHGFNMELA